MFLYLAMIDSDADKSKFEILYSEYKNLMYYTANRILRNSSDAEDVVHQAFLKVIEILDTISSPRCHKTRALLVTITEHKAIDLYRDCRRDRASRRARHTGRRYRVPAAALPLGTAPAVRLRLFQRGDCEYSGYDRAERAQAHPACQGKTQRSAERDGGTVNENH